MNENHQNLTFHELVDKSFKIELGSGTETGVWNKDALIDKLGDVIRHNLFDRNFYYNWTDKGEEYLNIFNKHTLKQMVENIDKTLNIFFTFERPAYSRNEDVLVFKEDNSQLWIDNWFKTNKFISEDLKKDYYNYREKYSGISLK